MIKVGQHKSFVGELDITGLCAFVQHYIIGFSLYLSSHSVLTQFVFVRQGLARPVSGVDRGGDTCPSGKLIAPPSPKCPPTPVNIKPTC